MINNDQKLVNLAHRWSACHKCDLAKTCKQVVLGEGNASADLMIIGEAPGADEDRLGRPFIGVSGQYLRTTLQLLNIPIEDVYITNLVGCRPPNNRQPELYEILKCRERLDSLFHVIQPKMLLLLGAVALQHMTYVSFGGINKWRGVWMEHTYEWKKKLYKIPFISTFHPAGLLPGRLDNPEKIQMFRDDIKEAWSGVEIARNNAKEQQRLLEQP